MAILLQVSLIRFPTTIPMHHHFLVLEVVLLELPTSTGSQHTPVFGLLTGVSLNGVHYLRSCCTKVGPAGSKTFCADWTYSAPRLKQNAPAQQP